MTRAGIFLALLASVACTNNHASAPPARAADSTSLAGGEPAPLAPVLSRFDVPLTWEFTDMIRTLERVVPKSFGSLDSTHQAGGDDRKHFACTRPAEVLM